MADGGAALRAATPADAAAVAAVHETARAAYYAAARGRSVDPAGVLAPEPDRLAMWTAVLADPARAEVWCAEVAGRVVGFVSLGPPISGHAEPVLELHALYVLPRAWSGGIGSRLHGVFTARLAAGPAGRGVLDVWSGNDRAIAFYARRGWVRDGRARPAPDGSTYHGMALPR